MAKDIKCPKCDFTSPQLRGVSRHLGESHGIKDKAERKTLLGLTPAAAKATGGGTKGTKRPKPTRRAVREPVAPNGNNPALALIDAEIAKMDARLADLHRARGIVAALGLSA